MSNLKRGHVVENLIWIMIVSVFYLFSFEFEQEIEIYKFGATGWPRAILIILLIVTLGNFLHNYKKGSSIQTGRVGIADDQEEIFYDSFDSIKKLLAILLSPLIYSMSLKSVGFYSATPFFIAIIIYLLGENRIKWLLSITFFIYFIIICVFMVVLNAPLPQGNVSPFYDFSAFLLTINTLIRNSLNF